MQEPGLSRGKMHATHFFFTTPRHSRESSPSQMKQRTSTDAWTTAQRGALAAGLCERQCSDGAWAGVQPDSCEDDPLVATSFALRALTTIRSATA
jgi:hypothetical protein